MRALGLTILGRSNKILSFSNEMFSYYQVYFVVYKKTFDEDGDEDCKLLFDANSNNIAVFLQSCNNISLTVRA